MALTFFVPDQPPIHFVPRNAKPVSNCNGDAIYKFIKPNLRPNKLNLVKKPLGSERFVFTLALLELAYDVDEILIMFLKCVQDVSYGIKPLRFNSFLKTITVHTGE